VKELGNHFVENTGEGLGRLRLIAIATLFFRTSFDCGCRFFPSRRDESETSCGAILGPLFEDARRAESSSGGSPHLTLELV